MDYRIDEKDSLFGSISWSNTAKGNVPPFQGALDGGNFYGSSEQDLGRNAQIGFTRIWTPTIISETRVGFSRLVTARTQANARRMNSRRSESAARSHHHPERRSSADRTGTIQPGRRQRLAADQGIQQRLGLYPERLHHQGKPFAEVRR